MIGTFISSNLLATLSLLAFVFATVGRHYTPNQTHSLTAASWIVFSVFWLNLIEHFLITQQSAIEGILTTIAVPGCLYIAYLSYTEQHTFEHLTTAIALMGVLYFPLTTLTAPRQFLVEAVTQQVNTILQTLGYEPTIILDERGFHGTFEFFHEDRRYLTRVLLACTGFGSLSIVLGVVFAAPAALPQKLKATAIAAPVIWGLNLIRITFITLAQSFQWLQIGVDWFVMMGLDDPYSVSYIIADRIIGQSLSLIALIAITYALIRIVPEITVVLDEAIVPLLGEEYALSSLHSS